MTYEKREKKIFELLFFMKRKRRGGKKNTKRTREKP